MNQLRIWSVGWAVIGFSFSNPQVPACDESPKARSSAIRPGTYTADPLRGMHLRESPSSQRDLNFNGIPDSLDIAFGFAQDTNHNGVIDEYDPDEAVATRALTGDRWWRFADSADSIYFGVSYTDDPDVTIRYTVPPGGASVLLSVRDSADTKIFGWLVNQFQAQGPYIMDWNREIAGRRLGPGTYTFRLIQKGHKVDRRMGWRSQ